MALQLQPTHHCFDDSLDYIEQRVKADPSLVTTRSLILVHAILVVPDGPHQGELYAHAWVEEDGSCVDAGLIDGERVWFLVPRDKYYRDHQVQESTRYTLREAWQKNMAAGNYGPWEPQYRALCSNDNLVLGAFE